MEKKLRVLTVVGTRPEIIRLSRVICQLDQTESIEHILVHTGQNYDYELNQVFFEDLGIRNPDFFLNAVGDTASDTIGKIISKVDKLFLELEPNALLILGDTNSCLCAIPAKKHHIPIFHMEAGNRCFDQRVPEETNRKIVDHISDINLPYSDIAREYLLREGIPADRIIKTGSPMFEVLNFYMTQIHSSQILSRLNLSPQKYFIVSAHREENINDPKSFNGLIDSLNKIAETYNLPIVISTHPRTRKKIEEQNIVLNPLIKLMKPLGFHDYNFLQINAQCVLSDSGTISEESSILNFPALNIRSAHERPEAMEEASVMMVGTNTDRILQGIKLLKNQKRGDLRDLHLVNDYSVNNVSHKVVRIILSYVDYINRVVWNE